MADENRGKHGRIVNDNAFFLFPPGGRMMVNGTIGPVRRISWHGDEALRDHERFLGLEWLVTNGLGGYASGTVAGVITRRYHGLLTAALPYTFGRRMMLNDLAEHITLPDGTCVQLGGEERTECMLRMHGAEYLKEFRLETGLPVWVHRIGNVTIEKRVFLPYRQNTVYLFYRMVDGSGAVRIRLRPAMNFRSHDSPVNTPLKPTYVVTAAGDRFEITEDPDMPKLRMFMHGEDVSFTYRRKIIEEVIYRTEGSRGYEAKGDLWSPGSFEANLAKGSPATLVASTESWDTMGTFSPEQAYRAEWERRHSLLGSAPPGLRNGIGAELVLAGDQFIVTPPGRPQDAAQAHARGDDVRTVIAGYHWFTDWGRDTMISLEGLALATGRHSEAGWILRTFARYIRDGLIPNMFPEGRKEGRYNTADATLWFFHAIDRYVETTGDRGTLRLLLPRLMDIVERHLAGTRFGIAVDPEDGLLRQGEEGYQLTWMDAKVGDWVVTPRRGKTVEINALWYNALRLLEQWLRDEYDDRTARPLAGHAAQARRSFNERFWYGQGGYLFDVVDGEAGDDPACRPNQVFSISLRHPVLERVYWQRVLAVVKERLLTPVGLRSLAPGHPDYQPRYYGDLRSRDAAYHQGTVWAWLIGPFIDAWLKLYPWDLAGARSFIEGFGVHMDDAGIGSIGEIYDADPPFLPRGCIAQAWSVAEVLRCLNRISGQEAEQRK